MLSLEEIKKAQDEVNALLTKYKLTLNVVHQVNLVEIPQKDGIDEAKVIKES